MSQTNTRPLITKQNSRLFEQYDSETKSILGFWIYLMTDCVLFGSLFAVFVVLRNNTFGGPSGAQLFNMPYVLVETLVLLLSSFTCGLAVLNAQARRQPLVILFLAVTFLLGATFLGMELNEFHKFAVMGDSWHRSGFLSAYFTLVGTHGLHITIGLLWLFILGVYLVKKGLSPSNIKRLRLFSLFWHFLDLVWIFIFTIVYLFGGIR